MSMRSLPWYVQANPDTFFPRCYSLCIESEKQEFLGEWGRETWGLSVAWPPACRTGLRAGGGAGPVPSQPSGLSLGATLYLPGLPPGRTTPALTPSQSSMDLSLRLSKSRKNIFWN